MELNREDKVTLITSLIERTKQREVVWVTEPYCQLNHVITRAKIGEDVLTLALLADHFDESMHYYLQGARDDKTNNLVDIVAKVDEDCDLFSLFIELWDVSMLTTIDFKGEAI